MSAILDLPTELQEFLLQPLPQTLLLRGAPGSGKTTLSVSMLHSFPGQRFLVSSRVTEAELQREFPWVQWDTQVKLIDITNRGGTLKDASRVVAHLKEVIENPEKEPGLRGLWLPPPLQDAWSGTDPSRPSMVVIDSWDALVERYIGISAHEIGFPDRGEIERILLDLMVQTPMFLVLVVERTDLSQLDFLVNGVIETVSDIQNGRPERWLRLKKLRGVRIDTPLYPFTLEDARFQCISPIGPTLIGRVVRPESEPDSVPGYVWPGCSDFAAAFGRLPIGRLTLIERDVSVPVEALILLLRPMAGHVARAGGRVLQILPPTIDPEAILMTYREVLSPEQIQQQIRFQLSAPTADQPEEIGTLLLPAPMVTPSGSEPRAPEAVRFLREKSAVGAPNLSIVWISALKRSAGSPEWSTVPRPYPAWQCPIFLAPRPSRSSWARKAIL
ncbi:MAG TPA: gas vesicle protein GvpD P-loop domain-containing protein [Thermoplasmata archaeon]|nr:gas vesicle protein GvpD P-loop domain-containing protein [Thermoplasmata archaeon]